MAYRTIGEFIDTLENAEIPNDINNIWMLLLFKTSAVAIKILNEAIGFVVERLSHKYSISEEYSSHLRYESVKTSILDLLKSSGLSNEQQIQNKIINIQTAYARERAHLSLPFEQLIESSIEDEVFLLHRCLDLSSKKLIFQQTCFSTSIPDESVLAYLKKHINWILCLRNSPRISDVNYAEFDLLLALVPPEKEIEEDEKISKERNSTHLSQLFVDNAKKARILYDEGIDLYKAKQWDRAIEKINLARDIYLHCNKKLELSSCLDTLASCYREKGFLSQAIIECQNALDLRRAILPNTDPKIQHTATKLQALEELNQGAVLLNFGSRK